MKTAILENVVLEFAGHLAEMGCSDAEIDSILSDIRSSSALIAADAAYSGQPLSPLAAQLVADLSAPAHAAICETHDGQHRVGWLLVVDRSGPDSRMCFSASVGSLESAINMVVGAAHNGMQLLCDLYQGREVVQRNYTPANYLGVLLGVAEMLGREATKVALEFGAKLGAGRAAPPAKTSDGQPIH